MEGRVRRKETENEIKGVKKMLVRVIVVGDIGFNCDHLGRWSRLGIVRRIKFHKRYDKQRWINLSEKGRNMKRGRFWEREMEGKWNRDMYVRVVEADVSNISRFIKDFNYTVISKLKGKGKSTESLEVLLDKNVLVFAIYYPFSILRLFSCKIMSK